MYNVGSISILSSDLDLIHLVAGHLDRWLVSKKWQKSISILKEISKRPGTSQVEIIFCPGEYQSNGLRQLTFSGSPDLSYIEAELHRWLYSVES